jgi:hypothetical protein
VFEVSRFNFKSGLKILAVSELSKQEYKLVLYLISCHAAGLEEIVTTEPEFANVLRIKEEKLSDAIEALMQKKIIHYKEVIPKGANTKDHSFALFLEADISLWNKALVLGEDQNSAVVYSFLKHEKTHHLELIKRKNKVKQQVIDKKNTDKIDIIHARKNQIKKDKLLCGKIKEFLSSDKRHSLSKEEKDVLKIISDHPHPRRQFYWAYRMRGRYGNLRALFDENTNLMISVTSRGSVIKPTKD